MSHLAFAALLITAAILLAVQHSYWRGRLDKSEAKVIEQQDIAWSAIRAALDANDQLQAIRARNGERRLLAAIDEFRDDFNVVSLDERRAVR